MRSGICRNNKTQSGYYHLLAIVSGLGIEDKVSYHFYACKFFPELRIPEGVTVFSFKGHCSYMLVVGYIQGPPVMKFLRNDSEAFLPEDIAAPQNAIQCAETGIVHVNLFGRYAPCYQVGFHKGGLIVIFAAIISANYNVIYFAGHVKIHCGINSVLVVGVDDFPGLIFIFRSAQQQAYLVF